VRKHKLDIEEESRKKRIEAIWETHFWHRRFMEKFIEGQRAFYNELYKGRDWVVILDGRRRCTEY